MVTLLTDALPIINATINKQKKTISLSYVISLANLEILLQCPLQVSVKYMLRFVVDFRNYRSHAQLEQFLLWEYASLWCCMFTVVVFSQMRVSPIFQWKYFSLEIVYYSPENRSLLSLPPFSWNISSL